jgi:hypothetical protein
MPLHPSAVNCLSLGHVVQNPVKYRGVLSRSENALVRPQKSLQTFKVTISIFCSCPE